MLLLFERYLLRCRYLALVSLHRIKSQYFSVSYEEQALALNMLRSSMPSVEDGEIVQPATCLAKPGAKGLPGP